MPWFSGSGGGLSAVTTDATLTGNGTGGSPLSASPIQNSDGVTLQGNGTAASKYAIKAVQTNASLSGAGTVASPLSVAGLPSAFYPGPAAYYNTPITVTANTLILIGFALPYAVICSRIGFYIQTADGAHNSDIGLYNSAGTLIAHIGATLISGTGEQSAALVGAPLTLTPGLCFYAVTSAAGTLATQYKASNGNGWGYSFSGSFGSSSGGVLPGSITPPAASLTDAQPYFALI